MFSNKLCSYFLVLFDVVHTGIEILELAHRSQNNMSVKSHYDDTTAEFTKMGKAEMQEIIVDTLDVKLSSLQCYIHFKKKK